LLQSDPCIDQAVVCGEGRNFLTALIVPHWGNVHTALAAEGVTLNSHVEDDVPPPVTDLLRRRVDTALTDVCSAEQIKKFIVVPQPFSVAAEELTVSLKLRRNVVLGKYARALDALYHD
jgi:long-chain acyl-CoA synthetase